MNTEDVNRIVHAIDRVGDGITVTGTDNIAQVNGVTVDVGTGTAGTGTMRVAVASDSTIKTKGDVADNAVLVNTSPNLIGGKAVDTVSYAPAYTAGDAATLAVDKDNGGLLVNQANLSVTTDAVLVHGGATTSATGAVTKFRSLTCSATGEVVKNGTGNLYRYNIINLDAGIVYLKFYDKATAATSADTPFYVASVPAGVGSRVSDEFTVPDNFANGLSVRCVTTLPDNGNTSPTAPIVEIRFK